MPLLNYKRFGEGQPLIIIHGFMGSLDNWMTLGKKFAEDFDVILVDQRNHGKSFHSDEWGYSYMVDDLEKLIDELELVNPILLGHSMGGKTVMQYAAFHDAKIDRLIVADIGPKFYPPHHKTILDGLSAVNIDALQSRQEADEFLSSYVSDIGIRTFLLKNLNRSSEGFSWKMNLPVLADNIEKIGEELSRHLPIETGSLFIRGGNSDYILDEDWSSIEEIFENSELATIEGVGHWLHAERPSEFYDLIMKFLKP
ncbi:MAG: alpha/beta fold hydrolase [Reichenbachiella sp.]